MNLISNLTDLVKEEFIVFKKLDEIQDINGLSEADLFLYYFCKRYFVYPSIKILINSNKYYFTIETKQFTWESHELSDSYLEALEKCINTCNSILNETIKKLNGNKK